MYSSKVDGVVWLCVLVLAGREGNLPVARHPIEGWRGHLQLRLRDPQVVSYTHSPVEVVGV